MEQKMNDCLGCAAHAMDMAAHFEGDRSLWRNWMPAKCPEGRQAHECLDARP